MISKINIKNFMSHKDTNLTFGPGINAIIGDPQNGKTGILRCFELLRTNRPLGANYFSNFAGTSGNTECHIKTIDNQEISLVKAIKINKQGEKKVESGQYTINGNTIAASTEVPDIVNSALMMTDLNIQTQLDPPFLITNSAGEVSRVINRITQLEEVDAWVSDLTTQVNEKSRQIDTEVANEKRFQNDLDRIQEIIQLNSEYKNIQALALKRQKAEDKSNAITESVEEILFLEDEISQLQKINIDAVLGKIIKMENSLQANTKKESDLINFISLHQEVNKLKQISIDKDIANILKMVEQGKGIKNKEQAITEFAKLNFEVTKLHNMHQAAFNGVASIIAMSDKQKSMQAKVEALKEVGRLVQSNEKIVEKLNETKEALISELKDLKICPTCFQEIGDEAVERIGEMI